MKTTSASGILKTMYHDGNFFIDIWKEEITKF